ncbi:MAG: YlmH/Sll1252 family protein [Fusobacteriaceae bacterium]
MDKKFFLNQFNQENSFLISSLWDDIQLCKNIDYPVYSEEFYTSNILSKLEKSKNSLEIEIFTQGINSFSERKTVVFTPKNFSRDMIFFPVKFFIIDGQNKFSKLQHKDFLGAIMALGIKREVIGDVLVKDSICYGIIQEKHFNFLQENVTSVGKVPVKVEETFENNIPELQFSEIILTLASLRFDIFVSEITNKSRNEAQNMVEKGEILLNYEVEKKNSKELLVGDIITIRGVGKFIFHKELGENKKGKLKVSLKKFI